MRYHWAVSSCFPVVKYADSFMHLHFVSSFIHSFMQVGASSYKPYCLVITTPEREFLVAARSEEERQEWQQAILSCIEGYDVMGMSPHVSSHEARVPRVTF